MMLGTRRTLCALIGLAAATAARAQTSPPALPLGASGETVIATVNRESITLGEWIGRMQTLSYRDFLASVSPVQFKTAPAGQIALESLVSTRLLLQYAARTSLLPADAEVDADLQRLKSQPAVKDGLDRKLFTEAQLRRDIVFQKALYNVATINQTITPDEVKAYYDRHPEQFGRPERWQIALIRVSTQAAADRAQAELKKGAAFATVASQLSEDPSTKGKGGRIENASGELDWFTAADPRLPQYVRDACKKLKVGEVTPVLQGSLPAESGAPARPVFFLVRLLGREEMNVQPLDQIRPQVERLALFEKVGGARPAEAKIEEFRKTSQIAITLPGYENLYKKP